MSNEQVKDNFMNLIFLKEIPNIKKDFTDIKDFYSLKSQTNFVEDKICTASNSMFAYSRYWTPGLDYHE